MAAATPFGPVLEEEDLHLNTDTQGPFGRGPCQDARSPQGVRGVHTIYL